MTSTCIDHGSYKEWRNADGKLHREDGPAVEKSNGDKFWLINDNLHRLDGPAVEYRNGEKYWYIHGKKISEKEFNAMTEKKPMVKEFPDRTCWYNEKGGLHRDNDLPAIEFKNGAQSWYKNGVLHRDNDKPAIIHPGKTEWWVNGKFIKDLSYIKDRNRFKQHVIDALGNSAFIFGGFVRDNIAGIDFRDVDVRVTSRSAMNNFIRRLRELGYQVSQAFDGSRYEFNFNYKISYSVKVGNEQIPIDILVPFAENKKVLPINVGYIDVDINALEMDSEGRISSPISVNIKKVIQNIKDKKFDVINRAIFEKRKHKLINKGFSENEIFTEEKINIMDNKSGMNKTIDMFKKGAENGAHLAIANQSTKLAKQGLIAMLEKKGHDNATCQMVAAMLDTDGGTAAIHLALSMALLHAPIPQIQNSERAQKMAQFFMDKSMETGMSAGLEFVIEAFGPALLEVAGMATTTPQLRVPDEKPLPANPVRVNTDEFSQEEIEAALAEVKSKRAKVALVK